MSKKQQEHADLSSFSLPQGLRPVSYSTVRISTIKDQPDQFTPIQSLATCKNTLLPAANPLLKPTTEPGTIQTPLYILEYTLLIPSASYKLYRTPCTHRITKPGNSQYNLIQYKETIITNTATQALLYNRL